MYRVRIVCYTLCCAFNLGLLAGNLLAQSTDHPPAAAEPTVEGEIRDQLRRYADAFNARSFDKCAELLIPTIVYRDESSGIDVEGADSFLTRLKETTEAEPTLFLEAAISEIAIESETNASVVGSTILKADGLPDERSQFVVTLTKVESGWKIAAIVERSAETKLALTASEAIESLGWLVGTWQDDSPHELRSDIEYLPGQQFLRRTITETATQTELGFEIIGYDPHLNLVRSWSYFADGSFGTGYWSGGVDHWTLTMTQTLRDGQIATGAYVIRPVDENTMNVKLISREIDGEPQPSGVLVTLSRQDTAETSPTIAEEK